MMHSIIPLSLYGDLCKSEQNGNNACRRLLSQVAFSCRFPLPRGMTVGFAKVCFMGEESKVRVNPQSRWAWVAMRSIVILDLVQPFIGTRMMKNEVLLRYKRTRWHSVIKDSSIHRAVPCQPFPAEAGIFPCKHAHRHSMIRCSSKHHIFNQKCRAQSVFISYSLDKLADCTEPTYACVRKCLAVSH